MTIPLRRPWLWGAGYGIVTAWLGMMTTGAGHGTNVLFAISSAPLGLFGAGVALVGTPLFWAFAGWFVTSDGNQFDRLAFAFIALVHYGGALFLTTLGGINDWDYLLPTVSAAPAVVVVWLAAYATGQGFFWYLFLTAEERGFNHEAQ